ncbi:MAG: TrkH family potassium uptake protein [Proteobacteria bacterium]|nr:TrkH family potassium uptake protein [Pseudomonadota bacterium]
MRIGVILGITAHVAFFVGIAMVVPLGVALYYGEGDATPIAWSMAVTVAVSGLASLAFKAPEDEISRREGMLITTMTWIAVSAFGALPLFLAKTLGPMNAENFLNCLFESVSGFTTTGSSILGASVPIEKVPHGLLFWRSFTHWLGGMGIIVLAVAILPMLGVGGMQLFRAEASAHMHERLRPRIRECAIALWAVYAIITVLGTVLYLAGGMPLFDSLCHTFAALASGGFSTKDASIGYYRSFYIEAVSMFIIFLGTVSFSIHYLAWSKSLKSYWRDSQFRYYVAFLLIGILFVCVVLYFGGGYASPLHAVRYGTFQAMSIMSTTGFAIVDSNPWPAAARIALIFFMFTGGCIGSTAGAIKVARVVLLFKFAYREIVRLIHPKVFAAVKLGGKVVHRNVLESIAAFFGFYMLLYVVFVIAVASLGLTLEEAASGVAATMGGVGPGFGQLGTMGNYFNVPIGAKAIFIACMLLGRLEIFTILVILSPAFWKK